MTSATSSDSVNHLRHNWVAIIVTAIIHVGAGLAFLPQFFSWQALGVAVLLTWVTGCLGITLGWHRLVSHRSFQVPKWLEYFLVICGSFAMQGGPIWWIGLHRHHHLHSDQAVDHHDSNKGFWWSHIGWIFREVPAALEVPRFTKDIADDPVYRFLEVYFLPMQLALAVALYCLGGWSFVIWGTFVRLAYVDHVTYLVNSATHRFGYRTYEVSDRSTNCWWVAVLSYGEGWHNNHHAFQYSARHGLKWWELDMTWGIIRVLQALGLATKVKLPDEANI
jgi:sn-1 stearoyl-lipid 9-desaturase